MSLCIIFTSSPGTVWVDSDQITQLLFMFPWTQPWTKSNKWHVRKDQNKLKQIRRNLTFSLISNFAATGLNMCWQSIYRFFHQCPLNAWCPSLPAKMLFNALVCSHCIFFTRRESEYQGVLLILPRAGVSIETALCEPDPALTCVDASWDSSSRRTVSSALLSFCMLRCVRYKSVILIDQSKLWIVKQEERRWVYVSYIQWDSVGSSSSSMIPQRVSQSVSQTSSFSVSESTVGQQSNPGSVVLPACACAYVCMRLIPQ